MPYEPDTTKLRFEEAVIYANCGCRRKFFEFIHKGWLPQPDDYCRFKIADLQALRVRHGYPPEPKLGEPGYKLVQPNAPEL